MSSVLYDAPGPKTRARHRLFTIVGAVVVLALLAGLGYLLASPRVNANGAEQPSLIDPSRWDIFLDLAYWRVIGNGVLSTLRMAAVAAVLALAFGVGFVFLRTANAKLVRIPAIAVLEFLRGMPVLLMMLFVLLIFGTGQYWAGVAGLALYNGAIISEILRAGIRSLPKGQREAGLAIGLSPVRTRFLIEFPQAFRQMLPILVAQLVVLLKDTALAYIVGYADLLRLVINNSVAYFGSRYLFSLWFTCFLIYLVMNLLVSTLARYIAKRTNRSASLNGARIPGRGVFGAAGITGGGAGIAPTVPGGSAGDSNT
jgi:glutamate transport system permease protein